MANDGHHVLFLSHAGSDTEAARALVERIEHTPEAQTHGLKVWFDKRDLTAGLSWQAQLEHALTYASSAFAVYVGSRGVVNWVRSEVEVALSRARNDSHYPFIPIISAQCRGSDALPPFARQYQGVVDVEGNTEEFGKLIRAAMRQERQTAIQLVDEPFLGLRAFGEQDTHLFFGRDEDAEQLVEQLKRSRLLMVVGDSGAGKSSLVKAGLIPRYRGGALVARTDPRSDDTVWHVIELRPRSNPFDGLADSVAIAARTIGRHQHDVRTLRRMVRDQEPREIADALADGAPDNAKILVVVDQFEELFTLSDQTYREPFIQTLLYLAAHDSHADFRVVLTMRRDYYNLCHEYAALYGWLEDKDKRAKLTVRRMSDAHLRTCIEQPLALTDVGDVPVFVNQVLADVGDQAGDLAVLEMALTESWRRRHAYGGDLLQAYTSIGSTAGALATVADDVYATLDDVEQGRAEASFMRLVRLGETGGTTRRVATRDEFSDDAWRLMQALAREDHGRLIHIGGTPWPPSPLDARRGASHDGTRAAGPTTTPPSNHQSHETAELSHEALVSQWPRYQGWLQASADFKRIHDGLIATTKRWAVGGHTKSEDLLRGNQLADALALMNGRPAWLSGQEQTFIEASRRRARIRSLVEKGAVGLLLVLTVAAGWFAYNATRERNRAEEARRAALAQLVRNYWIQGVKERDNNQDPLKAAHYFARVSANNIESRSAHNAQLAAVVSLHGDMLRAVLVHEGAVEGAVFNQDETRVLTWSDDGTARVWDSQSGAPLTKPLQHQGSVVGAVFNQDETHVLTWSVNKTARVWDSQSGEPLTKPLQHQDRVRGAVFNQDGTRVLTWSNDGTARIWPLMVKDEWPYDEMILKVEVETGTRLSSHGELEVIPVAEWKRMREEYQKIADGLRKERWLNSEIRKSIGISTLLNLFLCCKLSGKACRHCLT